MKNLLLALCFIVIFAPTVFSQEKTEAILFDEFGNITCCDIHARMDALIYHLMQNPLSKGYIQVFGNKNDSRKTLYREILLKGTIAVRQFDKSRISFIRSEKKSAIRTKIWIVPKGAEIPKFKEIKYKFPLNTASKPFMFFTTEDYGHCPYAGYEQAFFELLESNSNAKANFVIYHKNRAAFHKTKKELTESFSKISKKRLNFFYVKNDYENIEYWILPKKKRD